MARSMAEAPPFRRALEGHLRRRRIVAALEGGRTGGRVALAAALLLLSLAVLGVLPPPPGPGIALLLLGGVLGAGTLGGAARALLREGGPGEVSRALDRALRSEDLVATAEALAGRPEAPGRFAAAVLDRAAEEVGRLPASEALPLPRPPWRLLGLVALAALLVALLPQGGFGILPGLGSGWGTGGRPGGGGPAWGAPRPQEGGSHAEGKGPVPATDRGHDSPKEATAPDDAPPPDAPQPGPVATLALVPLARAYSAEGPLDVGVIAEGGPGAGKGIDLGLAVSADGRTPTGEGTRRRLAAGGRDSRAVDLRALPGMADFLGPGKHRLVGELRDAEGRTVARSAPVEVEVLGPSPEGAGPGAAPPPPPAAAPPPPAPAPTPAASEPSRPPPGTGKGSPPPESEPEVPPSALDRKLVHPLFGEGAEIEKRGPILVLDPEGSRGEAPRAVPPEEAVREVRARAEAAGRREGVDARDLETVRRYFEALRRLVEEKR